MGTQVRARKRGAGWCAPSPLGSRDGRLVGGAVHWVLLADGEEHRPRGRARDRVHQPLADVLDLVDGIGTVLEASGERLGGMALVGWLWTGRALGLGVLFFCLLAGFLSLR